MKANELMLGDWVYGLYPDGSRYNSPFRISAVDTYPSNKSPWIVTAGGYGFQEEHLAPIPITGEILEKNFQEFLPGINLMYQLKGPYCAMNEDGQWVFGLVKVDGDNSARYPLVKISFVHELQNALRLCGIKKEIEL